MISDRETHLRLDDIAKRGEGDLRIVAAVLLEIIRRIGDLEQTHSKTHELTEQLGVRVSKLEKQVYPPGR
jgi:hypothetical protein